MMTMITGFLGARLTNFLVLAPSCKMMFLTLTVVTGIMVHHTLYGEKNEYMVNFQTVYSVVMSEECEMSDQVNENDPLFSPVNYYRKPLNLTKKNR